MTAATGSTDTTATSGTIGDAAQEKIQEINQRAHDAVDKAAGAASKTAERVTGLPQRLNDQACDYVKAKPLQSMGIAFFSGLLLGKLLR